MKYIRKKFYSGSPDRILGILFVKNKKAYFFEDTATRHYEISDKLNLNYDKVLRYVIMHDIKSIYYRDTLKHIEYIIKDLDKQITKFTHFADRYKKDYDYWLDVYNDMLNNINIFLSYCKKYYNKYKIYTGLTIPEYMRSYLPQ